MQDNSEALPKGRKSPRPTLTPNATRELVNHLGNSSLVAEAVGCTSGTINAALREDKISQCYELAARHVLSKHKRTSSALQHLLITCPPESAMPIEKMAQGLGAKCFNLTRIASQSKD